MTLSEATNSESECFAGLVGALTPSRAGRVRRSCLLSLGGSGLSICQIRSKLCSDDLFQRRD